MKRTLIEKIPFILPPELDELCRGADIYDSSSSPEARVYYIDKGEGMYLKKAASGTLMREAQMTEYFHSRGMGAEVLCYLKGECDILVTSRVTGEDCTHADYIRDPKRLCDTIAAALRELHEMSYDLCPVMNRTEEYLRTVHENYRTGNYDTSHFPDSFGYRSASEAYAVLSANAGALRSDTLIHGDYCLPNIILNGGKLSGFIDLGNGGVGDRHIDLFWGAWTLWFNLGTDSYRERFFDAYGRDKVDAELIKTVAAAEVFG